MIRILGCIVEAHDIRLVALAAIHGAAHRFSIYFPDLALNDLSDRNLGDMLDKSGIKWRVVVISACYSGSFIDALKEEHTLILTAAAADRTSFGCSDENDWTDFGDAYINIASSRPQIYVGEAIKAKLQELETRLGAAAVQYNRARNSRRAKKCPPFVSSLPPR